MKDKKTLWEDNLNILEEILHDDGTPASVKIQAIQAREKIIVDMAEHPESDDKKDSVLDGIKKAMKS
jgi:hypothetical protein